MSSQEAVAFLKQSKPPVELAAVTLLVGEEETLMQQCLDRLRQAYLAKYGGAFGDFNVETLTAEKESLETILESCATLPLSAAAKLVVVRHLERLPEAARTDLAGYARHPDKSTRLVLFWLLKEDQKFPEESALTEEVRNSGLLLRCSTLMDARKSNWIREELSQAGKEIDAEGCRILAEQGGETLRELKSEIDKLLLFVGSKNGISQQDVKQTLSFRPGQSIWDLTNSIQAGNFKKAGEVLLRCLEQGEEPLRLLPMIAWSYRRKGSAAVRLSPAERKEYASLFRLFKRSDLQLKSSAGPEAGVLEQMIALCSEARAGRSASGKALRPL